MDPDVVSLRCAAAGGSTARPVTTLYDGGAQCWNGPRREVTVRMRCGHELGIEEVREPSTCQYDMSVTAPAACFPEDEASVLARLKALGMSEAEVWAAVSAKANDGGTAAATGDSDN